ncbi:hypothetical protein SeMB42_g02013 [Synchytrium endobioticum]|uniref:MICOS complex subunit MIC60 n=1 Tax=Synchytrium endobioticum TaxID=286115 RepID=A0A507D941_9FUNG|nr:hypothetical protein SeLEV6574_g02306 [Synchytrium endobioticum]TPX51145.1 hypothetical protein SeMB42_g02013 [Synchytrium endobioticum]
MQRAIHIRPARISASTIHRIGRLRYTTEAASTTSTTAASSLNKKRLPILRYSFAAGVIVAGIYGGAGYYSLHDEPFNKQFIANVPGAEIAIHTVTKLQNTSVTDIKEAANKTVHNVEQVVRDVREGGEKAIHNISKTYDNASKTIGDMTQSASKSLESVSKTVESAKDTVVIQYHTMQHKVQELTVAAKDSFEKVRSMVSGQPQPEKTPKPVQVESKDAPQKPGSATKSLPVVHDVQPVEAPVETEVPQKGSSVVQSAVSTLKEGDTRTVEAAKKIEAKATEIAQDTKAKVTTVIGDVKSKATAVAQDIKSKSTSVVHDIKHKAVQGLDVEPQPTPDISDLKNAASSVVEDVISKTGAIVADVKSKASSVASDVESTVEDIGSRAKTVVDDVKAIAGSKADQVKAQTTSTIGDAISKASSISDDLKAAVNNAELKVKTLVQDAEARASSTYQDVKSEATSLAKDAVSKATAAVENVKSSTFEDVESAVEKLLPSSSHEPPSGGFISTAELRARHQDANHDANGTTSPTSTLPSPTINVTPELKSSPPGSKSFKDVEGVLRSLPDQPLVNSLHRLVDTLSLVVDESTSPTEMHRVRDELYALADYVKSMSASEASRLNKTLEEHADKYSEILCAHVTAAEQALLEQAASLNHSTEEKLKEEQHILESKHSNSLAEALAAQNAEFKATLVKELATQAEELERYYSREVKTRVDKERAGRLARLDHLALKLQHLERIALDVGEGLERQYNATAFRAAVDVLRDTALEAAIRTGFAREAEAMQQLGKGRVFIEILLDSIPNDVAISGVATVPYLEERFLAMRDQIRRIQLLPDDAGPVSYVVAVGLSSFILPKEGFVPGNDVEAILARAEHWMMEGDLDAATREVNGLKGWPKRLADDWLKEARQRLEVKQVVDILDAHIKLHSLGKV